MKGKPARHGASETGGVSFGAGLLALRLAAGQTQQELAGASGVSVRTISELETGRRTVPQAASATMLADALGLAGSERDAFFALIRKRRHGRLKSVPVPAMDPASAGPNAILGRAAELAAIKAQFGAGARLVTLLGPGGIGKSRLARAVADDRSAVWIDLAAISDPALVVPAVARAAGASDASLAAIGRAFGDPPPLLILDNFEHLIPAAADLPRLLDEVPGLSVLVTTREPLRLAGELVLPVDPLTLPEPGADPDAIGASPAVALFLRTLAASAPSRVGNEGDLPAVAEIVTLLDGLPLAIELAAAQGVTLPAPAIARLLRNAGLAALARGRRDGPARFQTMEAAIAWSTDILPADAQRLFRLLGIFRGGFTVDALIATAEALGEPGLVAALPTLAEAQLVQRDPAGPERLRMLEPVRMFALDRLRASGEEPAARAAHARCFLLWARQQAVLVAGANPDPALDALEADLANLLVAFESVEDPASGMLEEALLTAANLSQYWELRLRAREGRTVLDRAADVAIAARRRDPAEVAPTLLMDAIHYSGYLAYMQVDRPAVERAIDRIAPLVAEDGTPEYLARISILRIIAAHSRGEPSSALLEAASSTLALVQHGPQEVSWHQLIQMVANLKVECGDHAGALPLLEAYLEWAERRAATLHRRGGAGWVGFAHLKLGHREQARASFARALDGSIDNLSVALPHLILLGVAIACSGEGPATADHRAAARLHGAIERLLDETMLSISPFQVQMQVESRARLAAVLGTDEFEALLEEGRNLDVREVLALARTSAAPSDG